MLTNEGGSPDGTPGLIAAGNYATMTL
jgi:hypothetical protein